jgi:hypothetical protein
MGSLGLRIYEKEFLEKLYFIVKWNVKVQEMTHYIPF